MNRRFSALFAAGAALAGSIGGPMPAMTGSGPTGPRKGIHWSATGRDVRHYWQVRAKHRRRRR